jgi:succinate dehydrogenase/fumarate reductase flavoprotein subunit
LHPIYGVQMVPGDLGTKGGLVVDENARVLRADGAPIQGLYTIGNTSASVMGHTYPGPGSSIGPTMTFGYVAAKYLVSGNLRPVGPLPAADSGLTSRQKLAIGVVLLAAFGLFRKWKSRAWEAMRESEG